jgi:hypothetical protein
MRLFVYALVGSGADSLCQKLLELFARRECMSLCRSEGRTTEGKTITMEIDLIFIGHPPRCAQK